MKRRIAVCCFDPQQPLLLEVSNIRSYALAAGSSTWFLFTSNATTCEGRHVEEIDLNVFLLKVVCTNVMYTIILLDVVSNVVWFFQKSNGFESPESSIQCNYVHTKTLLTWLLSKFIKVGLAFQV